MMFWIILWKAVFILGVGIFAIMSVWVIIAGFKDIKKLFATINKEHDEAVSDQENAPPDNS